MSADALALAFRSFRLPTMAAIWEASVKRAEGENWGYRRLLQLLCESEAQDRRERRVSRLRKQSGLPDGKTLGTHPVAAVTALTLLPSMSPDLRRACIECLRHGNPRLAYLSARWTRHTWPADEWRPLCDSLRATATRDRGQHWFHWFRDVETMKPASRARCAEMDSNKNAKRRRIGYNQQNQQERLRLRRSTTTASKKQRYRTRASHRFQNQGGKWPWHRQPRTAAASYASMAPATNNRANA
jgi:hypothetical protein